MSETENTNNLEAKAVESTEPEVAAAEPEGDVVEHRHMPEQRVMLKHKADTAAADMLLGLVFAAQHDPTEIGGFQAGDDAQQGGLTAAGRP